MMDKPLLFILFFDGLLWLRSSVGKLSSGNFPDELGVTLTKFASKNPYPWYKDFLQNIAIPNSKAFGLLTQWGELFVALSMTGITLYLLLGVKPCKYTKPLLALGLFGGMFLNATFWLASGWTSSSTDGLNLLMFVTQLVGLVYLLRR